MNADAASMMDLECPPDLGLELAKSMLLVLDRRLGEDFAAEVRAVMMTRGRDWMASSDPAERSDGAWVWAFANGPAWLPFGIEATAQR